MTVTARVQVAPLLIEALVIRNRFVDGSAVKVGEPQLIADVPGVGAINTFAGRLSSKLTVLRFCPLVLLMAMRSTEVCPAIIVLLGALSKVLVTVIPATKLTSAWGVVWAGKF